MTQSADVAAMVQACVKRFGRLDVLVNNVGGSAPGDPVSMAEDVWDRQIDFNLKTAFLGCKYAHPGDAEAGQGRDRQHFLGRRDAQRFRLAAATMSATARRRRG